jgi:predicted Ser/Thr protein kinase
MMKYPSRSDIVTAMTNPRVSFKAKELTGGSVLHKGSRVLQYSGGYTTVFPFRNRDGRQVAVRCWIADIGDAKKRSGEIAAYLEKLDNPYFSPFKYIDTALLVNGILYPVVIMDWVNGLTLKKYINQHIGDRGKILEAAEKFREMVAILHQLNIAHGDLQHGNILITDQGKMSLIDYDSMYITPLEGMQDVIKGLPGYQHPARAKNKLIHPGLDYFSELVIYLSLQVFAAHPGLWPVYYETEDFLFSKEDFARPYESLLLSELLHMPDKKIAHLAQKMLEALQLTDISELQPLEVVLVNDLDASAEKIAEKWDHQPNPPVRKPIVLPDKDSTINKF